MDIKPINENIKFPKVLVIDNNGKNLGPTKTSDAIKIAKEAKLDLILINTPKNEDQLPITKIGDYGKYLYEQKAKIKNSKQKVLKNKEITVRPQVGTHDLT
jgi:translation initiation factor IF-3